MPQKNNKGNDKDNKTFHPNDSSFIIKPRRISVKKSKKKKKKDVKTELDNVRMDMMQ